MYEEEEEDYLNDIISLNHFHIKTEEPVIDLSTSSDDEDDKSHVFAPRSAYGNRCFVLPITFFDVSRNVQYLKKCRPLSIRVVDCKKHPLHYENTLRPKTHRDEAYPEPTKEFQSKNNEPGQKIANDAVVAVNDVINNRINDGLVTENGKSKIETDKHKIHTARSQKDDLQAVQPNTETKSSSDVLNIACKKQQTVKCKNLAQVDLQRNKGLVGLVVVKRDSEKTTNADKIDSIENKISSEKFSHKHAVKDDGKSLNRLEKLSKGSTGSKIYGASEKDTNAEKIIIEKPKNAKESAKNVHAKDKEKHSSENNPTRCSIKITCPKVFEKAVELKNQNHKDSSTVKKVIINPIKEKDTTNDQTILKLNLKRKKSDVKEFYIISPVKEKSSSDSQDKKSKHYETQKDQQVNETQPKPTESESKIAACVKDPTVPSTPPLIKKPDNHQKPVLQPPKVRANDTQMSRNGNDLRKIREKHVRLESSKPLFDSKSESNKCGFQRSDKLNKFKNKANSVDSSYGTPNYVAKCFENTPRLSALIGPTHNVINSHENEYPNRCVTGNNFLNSCKTPLVNVQSTLKKNTEKIQNKSINYEEKSNECCLNVVDHAISLPKFQLDGMPQKDKTTTMTDGKRLSLNNQAEPDKPKGMEVNIPRSTHTYPHSLNSTCNNVTTNGTLKNVALAHLKESKNMAAIRNNTVNETLLPNQRTIARDTNFIFMKTRLPSNCKEMSQSQEKRVMQQTLPNTSPSPIISTKDSTLTKSVCSKPHMQKAIILKGSPRLPTVQSYGSPIPTVVNHNMYHPRPLMSLRFLSPWPPPNTNVVSKVPQVNLKHNGVPNCRMPFINTSMPRHAMYSEFWRPPVAGNYRNYFACPPPPPPPLPTPPPPLPTPPPAAPVNNVNANSPAAELPASSGTVIGSNAEGQLIKKITIAAMPQGLTPALNDKEEMLAELNSAVEELQGSSKLEEMQNNDPVLAVPVKNDSVPSKLNYSKPCPLSKKKYNLQLTTVQEKANVVLKKQPVKGYSPPILPIPSYQQAYEILAKNEQSMAKCEQSMAYILKQMECINDNKEVYSRGMKNKVENTTKNNQADCKSMKRKLPITEKRRDEKVNKISVDEYKKKLGKNASVSERSKSRCKKRRKAKWSSGIQDLGYDSDATLVL